MNGGRGYAHGAPSCPSRMRTCCRGVLAGGMSLLLACSRPSPSIGELPWGADTAWGELELSHDLMLAHDTAASLLRPFQVRHSNGLTFVTDRGNDRVAVIDAHDRVVRWIGSRGRGPGELLGVAHLAIDGDALLVAEALNGRVSEFSLDGEYRRSYFAPFAAGAVAVASNSAVIAARSSTHYAASLTTSETPEFVLRRAASSDTGRWRILAGHDLISSDSSQFWVFDQGSGMLCAFPALTQRGTCRSLPASLLERLRAYRDSRVALLERATRQEVRAAPLAKDLQLAGTALAILLPLPDMPAVLIELADGAVTPVLYVHDTLPTWARRATSLAWTGNAFVLVSDEGIGKMRLTRRMP